MNANTLKSKIDSWGIKHSWLAEKMGVSQTLLSMWFSGEREMTETQQIKADNIVSGLGKTPV